MPWIVMETRFDTMRQLGLKFHGPFTYDKQAQEWIEEKVKEGFPNYLAVAWMEPVKKTTAQESEKWVVHTLKEAQAVCSHMQAILSSYQFVSKADFLMLVGVQTKYLDNRVGWNNLDDLRIDNAGDDWEIVLPPVITMGEK